MEQIAIYSTVCNTHLRTKDHCIAPSSQCQLALYMDSLTEHTGACANKPSDHSSSTGHVYIYTVYRGSGIYMYMYIYTFDFLPVHIKGTVPVIMTDHEHSTSNKESYWRHVFARIQIALKNSLCTRYWFQVLHTYMHCIYTHRIQYI